MSNGESDETVGVLRSVPWPEASELADFLSIRNDLIFVQNCCAVACETIEKEESDFNNTVVRGMWNAAVVAYARAFGTGKRSERLTVDDLHSIVRDGDTGVEGIHNFVVNTRDKYVAHSVNGFESCQVGVAADADGQDAEVVWGFMHYTSPERAGIETLGALTARLVTVVDVRIMALRTKCEGELSRLSPADILDLPVATFRIASSKKSHLPR